MAPARKTVTKKPATPKAPVAPTVDAYIAAAPLPAKRIMSQLRNIIRDVAPLAEETIAYRMPMYKYHGMLVGFAAFATHVGFYAGGAIPKRFEQDMAGYKYGKGSIQLPLGEKPPVHLVRAIVHARVEENEAKAAARAAKKK